MILGTICQAPGTLHEPLLKTMVDAQECLVNCSLLSEALCPVTGLIAFFNLFAVGLGFFLLVPLNIGHVNNLTVEQNVQYL